jgi:hypothetical protein
MAEEQTQQEEQVEAQPEQQTEDVSRETLEASDRPEWLPEKFNSPEDMAKSYGELEKLIGGKKEDFKDIILTELAEETRAEAPETAEAYELPSLVEGISEEMVNENPLTEWWRGRCHEIGATNEEFQDGINQYIDKLMLPNQPNLDGEVEKLGENAQERLDHVTNFAQTFFSPEQFELISATLGTSAEGIEALERIQEATKSTISRSNAVAQPEKQLTLGEVREMMKDKRYYDPRHKDNSYIQRVDDAFARLYRD